MVQVLKVYSEAPILLVWIVEMSCAVFLNRFVLENFYSHYQRQGPIKQRGINLVGFALFLGIVSTIIWLLFPGIQL